MFLVQESTCCRALIERVCRAWREAAASASGNTASLHFPATGALPDEDTMQKLAHVLQSRPVQKLSISAAGATWLPLAAPGLLALAAFPGLQRCVRGPELPASFEHLLLEHQCCMQMISRPAMMQGNPSSRKCKPSDAACTPCASSSSRVTAGYSSLLAACQPSAASCRCACD